MKHLTVMKKLFKHKLLHIQVKLNIKTINELDLEMKKLREENTKMLKEMISDTYNFDNETVEYFMVKEIKQMLSKMASAYSLKDKTLKFYFNHFIDLYNSVLICRGHILEEYIDSINFIMISFEE